MASLFSSTKNTRYLSDNISNYIRSDVPHHLSEYEINWLLENNFYTIIDLRTKKETQEKPCSLANLSSFNYHHLPVTHGNDVPTSEDLVSQSYINMVDEKMLKIIDLIENSKTNVLYFCNAGKDRTGVVSAILLSRMGINDEFIIDDYLKSANNLKEMLEEYIRYNPSANINIITPKPRYIKEFLELYKLKKTIIY